MRILLLQNMVYLPTFGGANKANRLLMTQLAGLGHTCHVVARTGGAHSAVSPREFRRVLSDRGLAVRLESADAIVFKDSGVDVHAVTDAARLPAYAARMGRDMSPDLALVAVEDPGFILINSAFESVGPSRVVCLVHTIQQLPFGPEAVASSAVGARLLRRAAGVVTVSDAAATYLREWGGLESTVLRLPVYGTGPFTRHGNPDRGAVTMINPSEVKGIQTFLRLAECLSNVEFLAVPTWATGADDRRALARLPNLRVTDPVVDIDELFARTRVLVMPSIWLETFGMAAVEAMLRGIPVVASDTGGLPEAMLGVPHLLPALPVDTWVDTVRRLVSDRAHYLDISTRARAAATAYVDSIRIEDVADHLRSIQQAGLRGGEAERLSTARRRLQTRMLAQRSSS